MDGKAVEIVGLGLVGGDNAAKQQECCGILVACSNVQRCDAFEPVGLFGDLSALEAGWVSALGKR